MKNKGKNTVEAVNRAKKNMVSLKCTFCKTPFERDAVQVRCFRKKGRKLFCSALCASKHVHANHPYFNRHTELTCSHCKKKFNRKLSRTKRAKTPFCSKTCMNAFEKAGNSIHYPGRVTNEKDYRRIRVAVLIEPHQLLAKGTNSSHKNKGTYITEHRLVMAIHLNRPLKSTELVHHNNGNGLDNRIENLTLVSRGEHSTVHHREIAEMKAKIDVLEHDVQTLWKLLLFSCNTNEIKDDCKENQKENQTF